MAKIRPLNAADKQNMSGEVTQLFSTSKGIDLGSVESKQLFGDTEHEGESENSAIYTQRGYIQLAIPVLNFFLAGVEARILKNILNNKNIEDIALGRIFYSIEEGKEYHIRDVGAQKDFIYDSRKVLYGGTYIKYLIEQLDVEDELAKIRYGIVNAALSKIKSVKSMCKELGTFDYVSVCGTITTNKSDIHIIDGYYFEPKIVMDTEELKSEIMEFVKGELLVYNSRYTLLASLRESKSALLNEVMDYLVVLPIGYRRSIQSRHHDLSKVYDRIVRINRELRELLMQSNVSVAEIAPVYLELNIEIKKLMFEKDRYNEQYKSLFDILKGKKGFIRDKMQGTRIDYSGRSVIIVDPDMPMDTIGIPRVIAEKLMELWIIRNFKTKSVNKSEIFDISNTGLRRSLAEKALETVYVSIGRQPTLFQLGMRGFKAKVVDGDAVVISPLITPAFNADFDGDQMHCEIPVSKAANREVKELMSVTNNLFLPRSGECHIAPRQELIHGLWKASSVAPSNKANIHVFKGEGGYAEILDKVCKQEINVYDVVEIDGRKETAGKAAIRACLPAKWRNVRLGVIPVTSEPGIVEKPVSEKFFKELNKEIALNDKQFFVEMINKLVKLGFAITNIFPPSIPVLNFPSVDDLIQEFDDSISQREKYYNMGLETEEAFTTFYDTEYSKLESKVKSRLESALGSDNGYIEMSKSGARGNMSNIMQLFGMKGRVMKNSSEAFNAIIKHSLVEQLTGLEHMITAYGGRQGLIDKSIQTYEPGYISRKMSHTCSGFSITCNDCGTEDGLLFDYDFIKRFIDNAKLTGDDVADNEYVKNFMMQILVGRYVVGYDNEITDMNAASAVYDANVASISTEGKFVKKGGLKLRSPITCKNPCCAKCYGRDLGTNRTAIAGLPVGFVASQSIGEPGTQLTMKNFQSGGIAGVVNLTSSFDVVDAYANLYKLRGNASEPLTYDFVSPVEGDIETISRGDGTKKLQIYTMKDGKKVNKLRNDILLYEGIPLKKHVRKGESIQVIPGDMDVNELLAYSTMENAQRYLVTKLYDVFQKEVYVSSKHFEILVAGMIFNVCTRGNAYFKVGRYYTLQEYYSHDRTGCEFIQTIRGIGDVPLYRNDLFSTMFMEEIRKGLSRSILVSGQDEMKLPITRYSFGLLLHAGSSVEGYVEGRGSI